MRSHSVFFGFRTRAFTLVELLVVVAIITLLLSILVPTLSRAKQVARRTKCLANLRSIGQAAHCYAAADAQYKFPGPYTTGGFVFRQAPGTKTEGDPHALPETFGLAAVFQSVGILKGSNAVWVCPSASEKMRSYGNTYAFSIAPQLDTTSMDNFSKLATQWLVWDNYNMRPFLTGFRAKSELGYSVSDPKDYDLPHKGLYWDPNDPKKSNCVLYYDCHAAPHSQQ